MVLSHAVVLAAQAIVVAAAMAGDAQIPLDTPISTDRIQKWSVSVSSDWDVLGPFPVHAREQHFIAPSYPLNLTEPIDLLATYPSSYADGGFVGWTKAHSREDGLLQVSFPGIRWEALRATEGWAAMQHHNLLRTTLTVYPPSCVAAEQPRAVPRLSVGILQGSFFAVLPQGDASAEAFVPEWHSGNIYAMGSSPANSVELPVPPSLDSPTTYQLILSGDYEIRLFGDPHHDGSGIPKLSINLSVDIEDPSEASSPVERVESHDVSCDFVDGWAFGDAIGVGLRSVEGWWTVVGVKTSSALAEEMSVSLMQETRIAPTQTRVVPLKLAQKKPVHLRDLELVLTLQSGDSRSEVQVAIPVQHHSQWSAADSPSDGIQASYFFSTSMPTAFLVTPPEEPHGGAPPPPILGLHGAGVDIFGTEFLWVQALPRQRHSWVVVASGRTAWGLDWHGPSAREAFDTVSALSHILDRQESWKAWGFAPDTKVLLMGHSNGGQGAWFNAARNPDRIVGVVPAAGYIKSQAYVPWVQSKSAHYIDPALRAILDSSLTPDDNDLFLSNLGDTPILAIHGGDDDNVPVWHTRELVSIVKTWNPEANVTYREVPGESHWFDSMFKNDEVESFVSKLLDQSTAALSSPSKSFTLTVAAPGDSGSLHGWSIQSLRVPGRLARLFVEIKEDAVKVRTINVRAFSIKTASLPEASGDMSMIVDGQTVGLDAATWSSSNTPLYLEQTDNLWVLHASPNVLAPPPTGRIANFLTTLAPITIVVPTRNPSRTLSAALRIAHNLNVYHKLDAEIVSDEEAAHALKEGSLGSGNVVILSSGTLGDFAQLILGHGRAGFAFKHREGILELRGRLLDEPSDATLFLHPHPVNAQSLVLFLHGADAEGLERGLRLFPIRNGVTVPDWIVVGSQADKMGSGGVKGAGVWGNDWSWNEAMSAF